MREKKLKKLISILLVTSIFICFGASCKEDDGSGYIYRVNITENPENLDPQLAYDEASKAVIANMYQGLLRINSDGVIENAAALSYSLSDDNLTYTFNLKENIFWESSDGFNAELKAYDFVFAFERILKFNSPCPYSEDYYCIKNAKAVNKGELDLNQLGIKAPDDNTLEITLEKPYYNFLELMTRPSSMPCSEEFFISTKGRYGLSAETSVSNGAFYLKEWNFDPYWDNNYIILRRNSSNNENDRTYPFSVNFFITGNPENDIIDFQNDKTDCTVLDIYDGKILTEYNHTEFQSKSYGLVINPGSEIITGRELRLALAMSIDREAYGKDIPENLSAAYGIIPPSVTLMGKSCRELIPDRAMSLYNPEEAVRIWEEELEKQNTEALDNVKITVPDYFNGIQALNKITEKWQRELNFFCGIEVVSQIEYDRKIADGSYDILLAELNISRNEPSEIFAFFMPYSGKNFLSYNNMQLLSILEGIKNAEKLSKAVELYGNAESLLISDAAYIPLFYGNEYFLFAENSKDLEFYPFTNHIVFKEAKMF